MTLRQRLTSPTGLLIVVCVLHSAVAIAYVALHHLWWQWDEAVYVSQVTPHAPSLYFTAPRARGLPVLLFPVAYFTTGIKVIRIYLVALSSVGMYLGLRPWIRMGFGRLPALAAALLSTLWVTSFISAAAQPNFLVAVVTVGAVGYFLLTVTGPTPRRLDLAAVVVLVGLDALLRPSDATWLAVAMLLGLLALRSGRTETPGWWRIPTAAVIAGLALGWSEWVIEAYTSYGGFFNRLHEANAANTPGLHFSLLAQARGVNGPLLCRPCTGPVSASHIAWWFAVPPLVAIGLVAARGTTRWAPLVVATVCGTAMFLEYCITVSYTAPRFLLPAYALLAIPAAAGVIELLRWRRGTPVAMAIAVVVVALFAVQAVTQTQVLRRVTRSNGHLRNNYSNAAATLRAHGVHAPCVAYGYQAPPVAFGLKCKDLSVLPKRPPRVAPGTTVVDFTKTSNIKPAYAGWHLVAIHGGFKFGTWTAHVSPVDS